MTTWAPALVGAGGALLGALVAGVVALASGVQSRRWAHQLWVLERRHEVYGELIAAVHALTMAPEKTAVVETFGVLVRADVLAGDHVRPVFDQLLEILKAMGEDRRPPSTLGVWLRDARVAMHEELVASPARRRLGRRQVRASGHLDPPS